MKTPFLVSLAAVLTLLSCQEASPTTELDVAPPTLPQWAEQANIYEVNVRQYTDEGTLQAFQTHLPRLKELGVDILWFMPIQPIGELHRKGTLGSYYSISDYTAVHPDYGTIEDFQSIVEQAH
ncbi:MAG TPA: alpha-amylase, partial [Cryomorphaceae bacterium]|nr:alpha-amylase [Cryomorphaceae bacterium]